MDLPCSSGMLRAQQEHGAPLVRLAQRELSVEPDHKGPWAKRGHRVPLVPLARLDRLDQRDRLDLPAVLATSLPSNPMAAEGQSCIQTACEDGRRSLLSPSVVPACIASRRTRVPLWPTRRFRYPPSWNCREWDRFLSSMVPSAKWPGLVTVPTEQSRSEPSWGRS